MPNGFELRESADVYQSVVVIVVIDRSLGVNGRAGPRQSRRERERGDKQSEGGAGLRANAPGAARHISHPPRRAGSKFRMGMALALR